MSSKFQTKEFKDLQDKWYTKLSKSGFNDVEDGDDRLKEWDSFNFSGRYDQNSFHSTEQYFILAGQFLHSYKFETKRDRLIWKLHSEGRTLTNIADVLKARNFPKHSRSLVFRIMKRLAVEMLRQYDADDT